VFIDAVLLSLWLTAGAEAAALWCTGLLAPVASFRAAAFCCVFALLVLSLSDDQMRSISSMLVSSSVLVYGAAFEALLVKRAAEAILRRARVSRMLLT